MTRDKPTLEPSTVTLSVTQMSGLQRSHECDSDQNLVTMSSVSRSQDSSSHKAEKVDKIDTGEVVLCPEFLVSSPLDPAQSRPISAGSG